MPPADAGRVRGEVRALLLLQRLPGLADVGVRRLVEAFGSGRAAMMVSDGEMAATLGGGSARPAGIASARARGSVADQAAVTEALERADALGAQVVPMGSPDYPRSLLDLGDPPPVLFLRGRVELLEPASVALVGSRRATGYGRPTAARLARAPRPKWGCCRERVGTGRGRRGPPRCLGGRWRHRRRARSRSRRGTSSFPS